MRALYICVCLCCVMLCCLMLGYVMGHYAMDIWCAQLFSCGLWLSMYEYEAVFRSATWLHCEHASELCLSLYYSRLATLLRCRCLFLLLSVLVSVVLRCRVSRSAPVSAFPRCVRASST